MSITTSNNWWGMGIPDSIVLPTLGWRMGRWGRGHIAPCNASVLAQSSLALTTVDRPPHGRSYSCKTRGPELLVLLVREDEGSYK